MRRLLAVSWEMTPMYGPRATQVARTLGALVPLAWQPTVVCLAPRRGGPHWRDGRDVPLPDGVEAIRVQSPEEWTVVRAAWRLLPGLRDRPDSKWVWRDRAVKAAIGAAARRRFDVLATFAQPWTDHVVGLSVNASTGLPWVAHFSDPWIDSPYWRGSPRQRDNAARMEAQVVRAATALVFVASEAADLVMRKYPDELRSKVVIVPHGFDRSRSSSALNGRGREGRVRLVYTGRFYDGLRTPSALLRALGKLQADVAVKDAFELTVVGPFVTGFEREARALGVDHIVHFRDRVLPDEAFRIAAEADVLLVIDAPTDGPSPFLPSKLIDYLPLRKPILGVTPSKGASAALLKRLGGFVAPPGDEEAIQNVLRDIARRHRDGVLDVGPEFDRVAGEYDIARTTAAFSDALARACR
jgi:glycosyltransferase involved in cell wall biosynthesis